MSRSGVLCCMACVVWMGLLWGCGAGSGGVAAGWPGYEAAEVAGWLTVGQLGAMDEGERPRVEEGQRLRPVVRVLERGEAFGSGARYLVWLLEPRGVLYAERQRPAPVLWLGPIRPVDVPKPARVLAVEARREAEARARLRRMRER